MPFMSEKIKSRSACAVFDGGRAIRGCTKHLLLAAARRYEEKSGINEVTCMRGKY